MLKHLRTVQTFLLIFKGFIFEAVLDIWSLKGRHFLLTFFFWHCLKFLVPGGRTILPTPTRGSVQKFYLYIYQFKSQFQVVWPSCKTCQLPDVLCLLRYTYPLEDYPGSGDASDYPYFFPVFKAIILKLHGLSHKPLSGSCLGRILLLGMKTAVLLDWL